MTAIDNTTITENASNQLQSVGVVNANAESVNTSLKLWSGADSEYDAGGDTIFYSWNNVKYTTSNCFYTVEYPITTSSIVYFDNYDGTITASSSFSIQSTDGTTTAIMVHNNSGKTTETAYSSADNVIQEGNIKDNYICHIENIGVKVGTNIVANKIDATIYQTKSNLVTSVNASSTDAQYPSAKLFYDTVGNLSDL